MTSQGPITPVTILTPGGTTTLPLPSIDTESTSTNPASDPYLFSPSSASVPFAAILSNPPLLDELATECVAYAAANGIAMFKSHHLIHAPVTIVPAPFPRPCYDFAVSIATDYALLYDAISRDYDFLVSSLTIASAADEFLANLLSILHTIQKEGQVQPIQLGLFRSDYMVDTSSDSPAVLQVEYNTIAVSFAGLSTKVSSLHRYICSRHIPDQVPLASLPVNRAYINLSRGLAQAFAMYKTQYASIIAGQRLVIVMVVQEGEGNAIDQKLLEYDLFEYHQIAVVRQTLKQLHDRGRLDEHKQLVLNDCVVAVTYYRAGYHPRDYPTDQQWKAVLLVERSLSIACPSVALHLAGTKKIQQALTTPGAVERYLSASSAQPLRATFAGLWGLENDDDETRRVIQEAIDRPTEFVLKPQREGGGNNLWEDEMVAVLKAGGGVESRAQYILMKKIHPPEVETAFLREGKVQVGKGVSELGVYSAFIGDGMTVHMNEFAGHLLRTKQTGVQEGGVAAGFAVLDSPILT